MAQLEQALSSTGNLIVDPDNGLTRPRIDLAKAASGLGGEGQPRWRPFESFAGSLGSRPECLGFSSTQIDCWARLSSGELGWWRYNGTDAPSPVSLGGSINSAPSCLSAGGKLHCFSALSSGQLGQITQEGANWGAWRNLGLSIRQRPACVSPNGTSITCVAIGSNGKLYTSTWSGTAWSRWTGLAGQLSVRRPPICYPRSGGVDCLVVAAGNRLQHLRRKPSGVWLPVKELGEQVVGSASCVAQNVSTRTCFVQGTDKGLRRIYFNGVKWSGLIKLPGSTYSMPSCVFDPALGINCFLVSISGTLQQRRSAGNVLQPPVDLGGALFPVAPVCVSPSAGRLDCFAIGLSGALNHTAYY